jgi:pre-mRNA-splicing factor 38B
VRALLAHELHVLLSCSNVCLHVLTLHSSPFLVVGSQREPSSAFCLLLRLLTLRCTEKQMTLLLTHTDSPYIRAIGFLYLRFVCDPKVVYKWIEPYLYDDEPIEARASSAKQQRGASETMGEFVRRIFTDKNYVGTILPRLPIDIERDIQVKLLLAEKIEGRAKKHAMNPQTMGHFQKIGSKVMALYGDEDNPVTWYEAVVDRIINTDPATQEKLRYPKFVVTFTEYGNTETVTLGEMEMMGVSLDRGDKELNRGGYGEGDRSLVSDRSSNNAYRTGDRHRVYSDRGYDRGHSNSGDRGYADKAYGRGYQDDRWQQGNGGPPPPAVSEADLYEEVRRRERETVTSSSRNAIARRPPSTKASLSAIGDMPAKRPRSPESYHRPAPPQRHDGAFPPTTMDSSIVAPSAREKAPEDLAAIRAKKQKLLAKYG